MTDMPDILARICRAKRDEIEELRCAGRASLREAAERREPPRGFRDALRAGNGVSLIAEIKRASPSAGLIREDFDPPEIANAYERGGATCISVLTDREFFGGGPAYLRQVRRAVELPVLRKDFILDEMQVLEARALGSDAFLLIAAALEAVELEGLVETGRKLGMDALVEVHSAEELEQAVGAGADLIGINNRNLHTFEVSLEATEALADDVPEDAVLVAESGIRTAGDVRRLAECGVDAVLVGESLMRADDIESATRALAGA